MGKVSRFFGIEEQHSTVQREILAGFTTFISMVYILFVNPSVLGASGMDKGAVFAATALASAIGCFMANGARRCVCRFIDFHGNHYF